MTEQLTDEEYADYSRFLSALHARLEHGIKSYGSQSFSADPRKLCEELAQEALDVAGWGFFLWNRLQGLHREVSGLMEHAIVLRMGKARAAPQPRTPVETPPRAPEPLQEPPSAPQDPRRDLGERLDALIKALEQIPMAPVMGATIDAENPKAPKGRTDAEQAGFSPAHPVARIKENVARWRDAWRSGASQHNPEVKVPEAPPRDPLAELGFECSSCHERFGFGNLSEQGPAGRDMCRGCAEEEEA